MYKMMLRSWAVVFLALDISLDGRYDIRSPAFMQLLFLGILAELRRDYLYNLVAMDG
jgi:hypothetical protein